MCSSVDLNFCSVKKVNVILLLPLVAVKINQFLIMPCAEPQDKHCQIFAWVTITTWQIPIPIPYKKIMPRTTDKYIYFYSKVIKSHHRQTVTTKKNRCGIDLFFLTSHFHLKNLMSALCCFVFGRVSANKYLQSVSMSKFCISFFLFKS